MLSLAGQRAVVTGASSGIGLEIARALGAQGVALELLGRDAERLSGLEAELRGLGATARSHAFDLGDDAALRAFAASLPDGPDLLVHSAGVALLGSVGSQSVADLDAQYRLNLRAPFLLTHLLLPGLRARRGQVVFLNSGAGLRANAGWGAYAASKHGLKALADSLRDEVRDAGVRVTSVFPGPTATPMQAQVHLQKGAAYEPERFIPATAVAAQLVAALRLPSEASVTDLVIRPSR